jgi:hypothetical protein
MKKDRSLDTLLQLDGERFVIEGFLWVRFEVKQVPVCPEKPHGLDYSLSFTTQTANGCWDLTMRTLSGKARARELVLASNMTIGTRAIGYGFTSTRTRRPFWPSSGPKWIAS